MAALAIMISQPQKVRDILLNLAQGLFFRRHDDPPLGPVTFCDDIVTKYFSRLPRVAPGRTGI
jgi:hypothetical protein